MGLPFHILLAVFLMALTGPLGCEARSARAQELGWREYRSVDDGFAIREPVEPRFESHAVNTPFGSVTQRNYAAFPGPAGVVFVTSVADKNAGDPRSDADILAFSVKNVPADARTETTASGVRGMAFGYDSGAGDKVLMRVFVHNGRTFIVQAMAPKAVFPEESANSYLQSWRLLSKEIPAGWREYKYPDDGFAVSAPSRPAVKKETGDSAFGPVPARSYLFVPDAGGNDGVEFRVAAVDKHPNDTRSEIERLEAAAHAANPPEEALAVIRQSGLTGYYYELTSNNMRYLNATFVRGDKRYTITTRVPDGGVSPEAKAWMMSWRLLEPGEK